MSLSRVWYLFVLLLSLGAYVFVLYGLERSDLTGTPVESEFLPLMGSYLVLFGLFAWLVSRPDTDFNYKTSIGAGVLFRVALLFTLPNLSDDFYRFLWDGELIMLGENPFLSLPGDLMELPEWQQKTFFSGLFEHLNSQCYYTVYPPVLQGTFALGSALGGETWLGRIFVMKLVVLAAEMGTIWFLARLLKQFKLPRKSLLLYALNPLVVIELAGNLHFEAFMIFFAVGAFWFLSRDKLVPAAGMLALAIGSKLLPVLFFPFLIRRLGWRKLILFGGLTGIGVVLLFLPFWDPDTLSNFRESVNLYFKKFEYNASIYYTLRDILGDMGFWAQRILPYCAAGFILLMAWLDKAKSWRTLPVYMLGALAVYQFFAPVVHPWYLTPLVAYSVLTRLRFPILWGFIICFTYFTYYREDYQELNFLLGFEYVLLYSYFFYEWIFVRNGQTLEEWVHRQPLLRRLIKASIPARMKIKFQRIYDRLDKEETVLDLGTGNGGLCHALKEAGVEVKPVDIKDISFFPEVSPEIYDGKKLPYPDNAFDTVLLITVLHHTPDPDAILEEAKRVARKKVIVMEDIYRNKAQQYLTYFTDSLVNLEFAGHPHTNRTDKAWRETFDKMGLKLKSAEDFRTLVFFRQIIYVLEKEGNED